MDSSLREKADMDAIRRGLIHTRLRWLGIVLAPLSVVLFLFALGMAILGRGSGYDVLLGFAACGLSVACFGTHNDTAMALLRDQRGHAALPREISLELDREYLFRRLDLSDFRATPRMAWVITVLAAVLPTLIAARLLFT